MHFSSSPCSQVIGIISQLQEDMEKELAAITKTENDAITTCRHAARIGLPDRKLISVLFWRFILFLSLRISMHAGGRVRGGTLHTHSPLRVLGAGSRAS